jgi:flagellar hook-length control protein FliK
MDANLTSLTLTAPSASTGLPATAISTPATSLQGADFANLLGSLLAEPGRQDLAANGLAQAGLLAVPLSSQLELITPSTPVPDTGSLVAFARTQGLDETTLAALFGDTAVQASPPAELSGMGALLVPAAQHVNPLLATAVQLGLGLSATNLKPAASLNPLANRAELASPTLLTPALAGTSSVTDAEPATLTVKGLSELSWQMGKPLSHLVATPLAQTASATDVIAPDTDAVRLQLMLPREAIMALTRRLATMSGTGQAVAWGGLTANALASASTGAVQSRLDLTEFFKADGTLAAADAEVLDAAIGERAPSSSAPFADGARSTGSQLSQSSNASPVASQAGQRLEHYQQLADRLGQALAQRLQSQIERGEWKVQMRMDPVSLGRIDMELDMRAGGLDAVFRTDNPLTRELIAQGLPKLRESLSQSGTTVANVWVNGDSARQSGGNPTPYQNPSKAKAEQGDEDQGQGAQAVQLVPSAGGRQGSAGSDWDMLA